MKQKKVEVIQEIRPRIPPEKSGGSVEAPFLMRSATNLTTIPPEKSGGSVEAFGVAACRPAWLPFRLRNQAAPLKRCRTDPRNLQAASHSA